MFFEHLILGFIDIDYSSPSYIYDNHKDDDLVAVKIGNKYS